jgi:endonuclease/exonuclease/phosphatase family metal-dependent hydrolase
VKNFLILIFLLVCPFLVAQEFKAMSYNIKYDNVNDTLNNWNNRKEAMVKLLNHYAPSFVGMQEVLHNQLTFLDEQLPSHRYIGVGRDDGKQKGEYAPIFYNTTEFDVLTSDTFWLSTTPEVISVGWDASMERICTFGLFEHKATKQKVWVFNTHFDHIGTIARAKSAELIAAKVKEMNTDNLPVILMGDLNLPPESDPIQFLQQQFSDGQTISKNSFYGPTGTFSGFDHSKVLDTRIDYIFTDFLIVEGYNHIDDRMENNKHISDHLPVLARLRIK